MKVCIALTLIILFTTSAFSFDNDRKGFVIGGGLGFSPLADWQVKGFSSLSESGIGTGFISYVGMGFKENFYIVFQKEGVFHKDKVITGVKENIIQGFTGVVVYYFFDDPGESVVISTGIGLQTFGYSNSGTNDPKADFGFQTGIGYEFADHWMVFTSYTYGKTKSTFEFEHNQIIISVNFTAF